MHSARVQNWLNIIRHHCKCVRGFPAYLLDLWESIKFYAKPTIPHRNSGPTAASFLLTIQKAQLFQNISCLTQIILALNRKPVFIRQSARVTETACAVPEGGQQRGVDGVPIVHIEVIPAAFCGKVVEAQSEDGVGPEYEDTVSVQTPSAESLDSGIPTCSKHAKDTQSTLTSQLRYYLGVF